MDIDPLLGFLICNDILDDIDEHDSDDDRRRPGYASKDEDDSEYED